jgi:iron complex transport system ATP-binding protein
MSRHFGFPPELIREVPPTTARRASPPDTADALAGLSTINEYFAVGTGPVDSDWRPVQRLYTDPAVIDGIVERVQARIAAAEPRVAASILFLGFAARLWSIGLGAVVGHGLLPDLAAERLLYRETGGQITLHIADPVGWQGDDLESMLADTILNGHLTPLGAALQPISQELLRGNAASALLGAAREYDRHRATTSPGPGEQLARRLCEDERLSGTVSFNGYRHRRSSCCLYYRTSNGGLCGDCVFTHTPGTMGRKDAS